MTIALGLGAAAATAGALLLATGWQARRPDALRRGLGDVASPPATKALDEWLDRWSGWLGWDQQAACLLVLGESVPRYRRAQARVAALGIAAAGAVTLWRGLSPAVVGWAVLAVPVALLVLEKRLHARAAARRDVIGRQVLQAAQHVALAVTAGLTAAEALGRAAQSAPDPLAPWLARVHAEVQTGRTLAAALREAAAELDVPAFTGLADTLLTSAERGVPLAEVLMAQVADARARARADQLERAGRSEVSMLLPIVFLVLPSVVVVAVFPGAQVLGSI